MGNLQIVAFAAIPLLLFKVIGGQPEEECNIDCPPSERVCDCPNNNPGQTPYSNGIICNDRNLFCSVGNVCKECSEGKIVQIFIFKGYPEKYPLIFYLP